MQAGNRFLHWLTSKVVNDHPNLVVKTVTDIEYGKESQNGAEYFRAEVGNFCQDS